MKFEFVWNKYENLASNVADTVVNAIGAFMLILSGMWLTVFHPLIVSLLVLAGIFLVRVDIEITEVKKE